MAGILTFSPSHPTLLGVGTTSMSLATIEKEAAAKAMRNPQVRKVNENSNSNLKSLNGLRKKIKGSIFSSQFSLLIIPL